LYLFYIDETGNPEHSDPSHVFVLTAIAVHENQCRDLMDEFLKLKDQFYPELKTQRFKELKASDLLRPSRHKANRRNARFVHAILSLVKRKHIKIISFVVHKNELDRQANAKWLYPLALQRMLTQIQAHIEPEERQAMLILDSRLNSKDFILAKGFDDFVKNNDHGKKCRNIIELPLFSDSKLLTSLQIVDIISYCIYGRIVQERYTSRGLSTVDYSYLAEYWKDIVGNLDLKTFPDPKNTKA